MGQEFYVALESGVSSDIHPTILLRATDKPNLQEMATQQGLTPLWSYFSASLEDQKIFAEEFGLPSAQELEEMKKLIPPERWCELEFNCPEQWFEAADGLKTVRGLLHLIRNNQAIPDAENYIEALEVTGQVLQTAAKQGVRFHFAAIPS